MAEFESPTQELTATQLAAEQLLREIAAAGVPPDERLLSRLEKLATSCARLAYGNGLASSLSHSVTSLITWCDHLDDAQWKAQFAEALKSHPLRSPW